MLLMTNVKKSFNGRLVLDVPSLQLDSGIYWLKGVNGSGKTTLLKMVAGLLPFEGDLLFNGISLQTQPLAYRQRMSWAEAEPLYPVFMTGTELIGLYQHIRKVDQRDVDRLLDFFSIRHYMDNTIGTYSAGMTKKLSLVLAFLGKTPLILLDEPLITLDAESLSAVCAYIGEKCREQGTLFLLSSHQEADMSHLPPGRELLVNNQTISNV